MERVSSLVVFSGSSADSQAPLEFAELLGQSVVLLLQAGGLRLHRLLVFALALYLASQFVDLLFQFGNLEPKLIFITKYGLYQKL